MITPAQMILEEITPQCDVVKGSWIFSQNADKEATGLGLVLQKTELVIDVYLFNLNLKIEFVQDELNQYVSKNLIEDTEDFHLPETEIQKNRFYGYHLTHAIKNESTDLDLKSLDMVQLNQINLHTAIDDLWAYTQLDDEKVNSILDLYEGRIFSQIDHRPKKL
jgi:hypothetical protein